jgi:hypothetical protein
MFCRFKINLFFSILIFSYSLHGQKELNVHAPNLSAFIYSYTIDTVSGIIYYGGNSAVGHLGAINGTNGTTVAWGPFALGGPDEVDQVLFSNNTIYIAGVFSKIKGVSRTNLAAVDANGNLLSWDPAGQGTDIGKPTSIAADKNYLYVGQFFSSVLSVIDKNTGGLVNNSVTVDDAGTSIIKIACRDSFVFVLTESDLIVYKWEYDAMKNPTALKIVADNDLSIYGYYFDLNQYYGRGGGELVLFNDEIDVIDDFNYSGKRSGVLKFKWFEATNELRKQNYDIDAWEICIPTTPVLDKPDYLYQPKINNAAFYDSTLYIGGYELSDMKQGTCGDPYSILQTDPYQIDSLKAFSGALMFGPDYYDARQLKAVNNTLYQVSTRKYVNGPNIYTIDYLSAHCLAPMRPSMFTTYKAAVCPEDIAIKYSVQNVPGTTYKWTYSGTGATIHSTNTNSITVDFSLKPTPGKVTVVATSACGLKSPPRSLSVTINNPPNVNAGSDMQLNCSNKAVMLSGSSNTTGAMYNWKYPDGTTNANAQVTVNKIGKYILTVTDPAKGCHWRDTTLVTIDTINPKPLFPAGNQIITCLSTTVDINGSSAGVTDSLRWKDPGGISLSNPLRTGIAGNYKLIVLNRKTGCVGIDSINITSSKTPPIISSSFSSADLTCKVDSIILSGNSSTPNTLLQWIGAGDTLPNPVTISKAGAYLLQATDTTNGCKASKAVVINNNKYKPAINAPVNGTITCSSPSIILTGSSGSINTLLNWSGPGNYISTNPATVATTGAYAFIVTDTVNGCVSSQQVIVDAKSVLGINKMADTTICRGSNVTLNANPLGGTPTYLYTWKNDVGVIGNGNSQIVSPTDTMVYTVTISDNNGCVGKDSIRVFVPAPISAYVKAFQSCDPNNENGQLQITASDGIAPYQYSIDGINFQTSAIFQNLGSGQYVTSIKDALGCMQTTTAEISNSSLLPTADFLVSTNNMKGDTFVIIDISDPRPDKIIWSLPSGSQLVDSNMFSPNITYDQTGSFTITMKAYYGGCEMILSKTIYFTPFDSTYINANNNNGIEELTIYPNPNNGTFSIELKLYVKQTSVLQVFDATSVEKYKQVIPSTNYYSGSITIPQAENGTYILKVTAEHDAKQKAIVVNK